MRKSRSSRVCSRQKAEGSGNATRSAPVSMGRAISESWPRCSGEVEGRGSGKHKLALL